MDIYALARRIARKAGEKATKLASGPKRANSAAHRVISASLSLQRFAKRMDSAPFDPTKYGEPTLECLDPGVARVICCPFAKHRMPPCRTRSPRGAGAASGHIAAPSRASISRLRIDKPRCFHGRAYRCLTELEPTSTRHLLCVRLRLHLAQRCRVTRRDRSSAICGTPEVLPT